MNKKLLILFALALVVLPVAACGRTAPTGLPLAHLSMTLAASVD